MGVTGSKVRASLGSGSKVRASLGSSHILASGAQGVGGGGKEAEAEDPPWELQRGWEYVDFQPLRSSSFWASWLAVWGWGRESVLAAPTHATLAVSGRDMWPAHPREKEVAITGSQPRRRPLCRTQPL